MDHIRFMRKKKMLAENNWTIAHKTHQTCLSMCNLCNLLLGHVPWTSLPDPVSCLDFGLLPLCKNCVCR